MCSCGAAVDLVDISLARVLTGRELKSRLEFVIDQHESFAQSSIFKNEEVVTSNIFCFHSFRFELKAQGEEPHRLVACCNSCGFHSLVL